MNILAVLAILLSGLGLCGYLVFNAFRHRDSDRPNAENNWQNRDFSARERVGSWSEASNREDESTAGYHHGQGTPTK